MDVSSELPELRRRAGLSTWRVWYRAQWQASWDELQARFPRKCPPFESLFPPTADEAREMQLGRCMRLLPHDNDGGGFFVAVFEKIAEHAPEAGVLPPDEPEICVTESSAMLPEALTAKAKPTEPKGSRQSRNPDWLCPACGGLTFGAKLVCFKCGADKPAATADAATAAATTATAAVKEQAVAAEASGADATEGAAAEGAAVEGAAAEDAPAEGAAEAEAQAARGLQVLHACGGATRASAVAAAAANKFAPLYVPSAELLASVASFSKPDPDPNPNPNPSPDPHPHPHPNPNPNQVASFYGLGPSFPLHRLLVRSMQGLTLVLVAEEVLELLYPAPPPEP